MRARNVFPGLYQFCSTLFLLILLLPHSARGQGLEVSGGWAHITQESGTDGFNVGGAWWFTKQITAAVDYENSWDNTTLGTFTFTQTGPIAVKSHLQSAVVGPRIFFSTKWTDKYKLNPFGEAQFGMAHLSQTVTTATDSVSASDTAFTWLAGGGVEYLLSPHWSARGNLDFMRTQIARGTESFEAAGRGYLHVREPGEKDKGARTDSSRTCVGSGKKPSESSHHIVAERRRNLRRRQVLWQHAFRNRPLHGRACCKGRVKR